MNRARLGRGLLAGGWLLGWGSLVSELAFRTQSEHDWGFGRYVDLDFLLGPWPSAVGTLVAVVLLADFLRARRPMVSAIGLFLLMFLLSLVEPGLKSSPTDVGIGKVMPGAVMVCLAVGMGLGRRDVDGGWGRGVGLASGVAGALYVWGAMSKLLAAGAGWALKANLGLLIVERSFLVTGPWSDLRMAVGMQPAVVTVLGTVVIAVEASGGAFVVARARPWVAGMLTAMHAGLFVLLGYHYLAWVCCLWGLVLLTPRDLTTGPVPDP